MKKLIHWKKKITKEDIDNALGFLGLNLDSEKVSEAGKQLKKNAANVMMYKVSDLIRASGVEVERGYIREVSAQLQKILNKEALEPIIVVSSNEKLYIGDGYHRICACNAIDDEIEVAVVKAEL